MKPNSKYCKKYREKNIEKIRAKDKERKKFNRDYLKFVEKEKYEEQKRKDRERKRIAKEKKAVLVEVDQTDVIQTSSFKHRQTLHRSLKKADNALPNSPRKKEEIVKNLAKKYNIKVNLKEPMKKGRKAYFLSDAEESWIENALDKPEVSYMNPGKNDHFTKNVNGEKIHVQKRYLLWPLRDVLDVLNGSEFSNGFLSKFQRKLSFSLFYKFIKARKQYIFNSKIPQNSCLCEICENAVLLSKGIKQACKTKSIPTDPHAIVEQYSCYADNKSCMSNKCDDCKHHGLTSEDFCDANSDIDFSISGADSEEENSVVCSYYQWKKGSDGFLTKIKVQSEISEALALWQSTVEIIKLHIHVKRRQYAVISSIKENLDDDELIIYLDYSENYKCCHQNEIQSAYFGNKNFSLFTACAYYLEECELQKLPITVTTEENDKSRIASISCVNKVINFCKEKLCRKISRVNIVSDGCSAQFRSKYVFNLLIHFQKDIELDWHYNEAHHGKGPMDGIGGTIKNLVYRKVMSGDVVINSPEEFALVANEVSKINCLFLKKDEVLEEPVEVSAALPIPSTLKIHKVQRVRHGTSFFNNFFYLSEDTEPFFSRKYGVQCGHNAKSDVNDDICSYCENEYVCGEEWIECPICSQWYHEACFFK